MSSQKTPRRNLRRILGGAAVTAMVVTGLAFLFNAGNTSANYSSSAPVVIDANAGTLKLTAAGTLTFTNLVPGHAQSSTVTFTNTGTVKGDDLKVGNPVTVNNWSLPSGQMPDLGQVYVTVPQSTNVNVPTKLTQMPAEINLGSISANGGTKTMTVKLEIRSAGDTPAGDAKDNKFQGASVNATVTGTARTN